VARKQACIDEFRAAQLLPWNCETARQLHDRVTAANAALAPWVAGDIALLDAEEASYKERLRAGQLLGSREHSFCLFPREAIVPALSALARG
jgi:hypothetical protein